MILNDFKEQIYSQFGEDGITKKIFDIIGYTDKVCVEIGVESGIECCSRVLWEDYGFEKHLFDSNYENPELNLKRVTVTVDNVLDILKETNISETFDFLSVDIDSYDFYVVHKILSKYKPRVLVVESHPIFLDSDKVVLSDNLSEYPKNGYHCYGASSRAWFNSLKNEYDFVCHEESGINMFFVKKGIIQNDKITNINNFEKLYKQHEHLKNYTSIDENCVTMTGVETLKNMNL